MSVPEPSPAAPTRRSHGCLWSCLGIFVLISLIGGATLFYGSWFMYKGFRSDPSLESAISIVKANPTARDVLGDDIAVVSMESETFSAQTGQGKTVTYQLRLKGAKGEGQLHVLLHSAGKEMKIVSMVLTGPDDERYNLMEGAKAPSSSI